MFTMRFMNIFFKAIIRLRRYRQYFS